MSNIHWTSLSPNLRLKVVFLFQSFLAITAGTVKKVVKEIIGVILNYLAFIKDESVWFTMVPFKRDLSNKKY